MRGEEPAQTTGAVAAEPRKTPDRLAASEPPAPFTRFLRAWEPGREPEPSLVSAMWSAFGQVVRQELRRRSLSEGAPQWLGIYGFRGWWEVAGRGGPFEDLLAEAYRHVFIERLPSLQAQALAGFQVEALVRVLVRNFLHDRRRLHDRLGSRLFEVLASAVRQAVARGDLAAVSGAAKIESATVLATGERTSATDLAPPERLATIARRWNDELLPDLVTASRAEKSRLVAELARRLAELELAGIAAFRFRDLLAPLQADVRRRWAALLAPAEEEPADDEDARGFRRMRHALDPTLEDELIAADRFAKLLDCVDHSIEASPASPSTRDYLRRILVFVRDFATEGGEEEGGADEGQLPSFRRLAEHLKIPRDRFSGLMSTLRSFLEGCIEGLNGDLARAREVRS